VSRLEGSRSRYKPTFSYTPEVLAALDGPSITSDHVFGGADDREGHGLRETANVLDGGLIIVGVNGRSVDADALSVDNFTNALLEDEQVVRGEGVSLCNNWNQVHACAEALHDFNIQRLQAEAWRSQLLKRRKSGDIRVTSGSDEEQACMHTQVGLLSALRLLLLPHICFMLVVHEVDDWAPRVAVVDIITEARGVNDGELDLERLLLELGLDDFDLSHKKDVSGSGATSELRVERPRYLSELVKLLNVTPAVVLRWRQFGSKECIDEGSLA